MKKQLVIMGIISLLVGVGLSGCTAVRPVVEGTGTIVYNDFEGGFYGIVADSFIPGYPIKNLDPINLPQEYMEDGLRVWFKVQLRPYLISFHIWGILVEILEMHNI
jgi:inhibitor of cysteine peptidase